MRSEWSPLGLGGRRVWCLFGSVPRRGPLFGEPEGLSSLACMTGLGIENVRAEIDDLDRQIVELVSRRQHWVQEAGKLKADGDDVRAPDRVEKVISKVRALAEASGAAPDVVERTYRAMIAAFIDLELSIHENHNGSSLAAEGH